jgi:general secretion pathway protein J
MIRPGALRSSPSSDDRGFTLIELLVTLTLLSLLSLVLFTSIHFGARLWEASQSVSLAAANIRSAQAQIAELISSAYPKLVADDATAAHVEFDGQPSTLKFMARDPSQPGAMALVSIATWREGSALDLTFARGLELAAQPGTVESTSVVLKGLRSLKFEYFGSDGVNAAPAWHDRWQGMTRPPQQVRIRIVFADPRVRWPDLIVSPRIAADVGCVHDPLTKYCQGR